MITNLVQLAVTKGLSKKNIPDFSSGDTVSVSVKVKEGVWPSDDNPLANSPHTAAALISDDWSHTYTRQEAAYPSGDTDGKYWPAVGRIDNVYGDKHLICSCPPLSDYASDRT